MSIIEKISLHRVGNKQLDETLIIADRILIANDSLKMLFP